MNKKPRVIANSAMYTVWVVRCDDGSWIIARYAGKGWAAIPLHPEQQAAWGFAYMLAKTQGTGEGY